MSRRINFLLPVKNLIYSKQRLANVLSACQRIELTKTLLENNLATLRRVYPDQGVLVVTPDPEVGDIAKRYQADLLWEASPSGLNNAVQLGTAWSIMRGYQTQIVIAPDLAFMDETELRQLFSDSQCELPKRISICAATDWGTNALLTTPPDAIQFQYGRHSAKVMALSANKKGIPCRLMSLPHFSRDIDRPEDLNFLCALGLSRDLSRAIVQ